MANQRIASALSHQADTTGFVPSAGYEEGNRSFSTDAIVVDIEASLDCLYGEDVDLDWEQMLAPVELGSFMFEDCGSQLETTNASLLSSDTCACEQSTYWSEATGVNCSSLPIIYYYHPDYLGSVEFITDMRGDPYQFFLNTVWGENLQNQLAFNTTAFSSRFRFNGKEWDEETGNFYYGARYYDPKVSVWLSADPLASEAPHLTPYRFSFNNPLNVVDPNGLFEIIGKDTFIIQSEGDEQKVEQEVVDTGDDTPNRLFIEDPNATSETPNRLERDGKYFIQVMIPSSEYTEADYVTLGSTSQFEKDRRSYIWGSGVDYTDESFLERIKESISDDPVTINDLTYLRGQGRNFKVQAALAAGRKGERRFTGKAANTNNPFKHLKVDPKKKGNVIYKHPQTGKKVSRPATQAEKDHFGI